MRRWASGSYPTGEYVARADYDAGYRDGYRAAQERHRSEIATLVAQHESLLKAVTDAQFAKPMVITVSAEDAAKLCEDLKREGD